ncbi:MAG: glycosyltransferase family 2 protein [Phycisphaerae bacterium]|nr:glycosyltransferase family 2 protein [Phycisphaerae bacterium]
MPRPLVSIIIPVYNEQENLPELHRRLCDVLDPITRDAEFIMVDDGSRDDSVQVIELLRRRDSRIVLVEFSRNFGKESAMIAGYDQARGRASIVIDADLQTPPEIIPKMIKAWQNGAQIVDAVRTATIGQNPLRTWASSTFYWVMQKLAKTDIIPNSVDFRLLDAQVVDALRQCRERYRFNRGLVGWLGFRRQSVEFVAEDRAVGASRWGLMHLVGYALDAILSFSALPLRLAGLLGLAVSFMSFLYLAIVLIRSVCFSQPMAGYATLVGGIFLLGGMQLLTVWLLGEYVGRLYDEVKQRPLYIVRRVVSDASDGSEPPPEVQS